MTCPGCGYDGPGGHCLLCHEPVDFTQVEQHLRDAHPELLDDRPATQGQSTGD